MTDEKTPVQTWLKSLVSHGNTITLTIPALARRSLGLHSYSRFLLELYPEHLEIWPVETIKRIGRQLPDQIISSPKRGWRMGSLTSGPRGGALPLADADAPARTHETPSRGGTGRDNSR